jgi:hypothetical protein
MRPLGGVGVACGLGWALGFSYLPTIAPASLRPNAALLGAPGTSTGVNGPLAPLASRNPRAPARGSAAVGATVNPTIWPRLLRS